VSIAVGAALITVVSYRLLLAAIAAMMVVACIYWLAGQGRNTADSGAETEGGTATDLAEAAAVARAGEPAG
jgi:hypothetical protein